MGYVYHKLKKTKARQPGHWPEKKRIEVVTTYLALGKAPMVEAVTGVPRQTIRYWKLQPWWKELVEEIQQEESQELDSKLSKIIDKSLDVVVDRLEHGDYHLDVKTGTISRVGVKARDAHRISSDMIDKRSLIRKAPKQAEREEAFTDRLLKIAEQFASMGKAPKEPRIIEGEVITDAIYDQRQERLQERIRVGAQEEAKESEGSDGEEQGSEYNEEEGPCEEGRREGCGTYRGDFQGWEDDPVESEDAK